MSEVQISRWGERVALLEIRRPPNNFFDEGLLREVADGLLDLDEQDDVSVVVLASEGRHFCAGVDLRGMQAPGIRRVYRQALRVFAARKPLVAAVQGRAVGGGLGLALACDFRVVAPETRLVANFAQLGFHHGFGLSVTLPAVVGRQRALELLYTGREVQGVEAASIGLADQLANDPRAGALALGVRVAGSAPLALPAIRATMRRELVADVGRAMDLEADAQAALLPTQDFAEGIAAARERRAPQFTGT